MNKTSKLAAAASLVESIASSLVVEAPDAAVIAATKAPAAKPAPAVKAPKVVKEKAILSEKELAVLKVIAASDFKDPSTSAVPSYVVAMEAEPVVATKAIPGVLASLNKKGMLLGDKVKGVYMVVMTAMATDTLKASV